MYTQSKKNVVNELLLFYDDVCLVNTLLYKVNVEKLDVIGRGIGREW